MAKGGNNRQRYTARQRSDRFAALRNILAEQGFYILNPAKKYRRRKKAGDEFLAVPKSEHLRCRSEHFLFARLWKDGTICIQRYCEYDHASLHAMLKVKFPRGLRWDYRLLKRPEGGLGAWDEYLSPSSKMEFYRLEASTRAARQARPISAPVFPDKGYWGKIYENILPK